MKTFVPETSSTVTKTSVLWTQFQGSHLTETPNTSSELGLVRNERLYYIPPLWTPYPIIFNCHPIICTFT